MKLLALDTSSLACTAGVMHGDAIFTRYEEQPREHTRLLMPMVREVLAEASLKLAELDAIVLGNGPGSFIGMRIAASVAQGLAFGAGLEIVPVSSMAAVAALAGKVGDTIAVTQDAHMQQVYMGIYRLDNCGLPQVIANERLQSQDKIAELTEFGGVTAAGFGWHRYPLLLEANRHNINSISEVLYPSAQALLTLGDAAHAKGDIVSPERIDPAYLRQKVAERPGAPKP